MENHKLTKAEMIDAMSDSADLTKVVAREVLNHLLETIKSALVADRTVELRGFGTFLVRTRNGRTQARNPKTGSPVTVNQHGSVIFKPGKELKDATWGIRK